MLFDKPQKLPLQMNELKKIIEEKSANQNEAPPFSQKAMMIVDYAESTLKGKFFLNYVSNLKLSITLSPDKKLSKEDRMEMVQLYMESANVVQIETLIDVIAVMLLESKGEEIEGDFWLSEDERKEFRKTNKETIKTWSRFLESILIGMPFCVEEYAKTIGKDLLDEGNLEIINDANAVGKNIGLLIDEPEFLDHYLAFPVKEVPALYEAQWFEPVFAGYSLMSIMQSGNSSLFPFMVAFMEGWIPDEKLKDIANIPREVA